MLSSVIKSRTSVRLVLYIIFFSSLVTVFTTVTQLYFEYKDNVAVLNHNVENVKVGYQQGLTNALWLDDKQQLVAILRGINALPDINYVEVRTGSDIYASSGQKMKEDVIQNSFHLLYVYDGQLLTIGEAMVEANLSGIYHDLLKQLWVLLASNAVKTFLVAIFMFFIFDKLVFRKLNLIFEFARSHDVKNLDSRVDLGISSRSEAPDEIELTAIALNKMQEHLSSSFEELLMLKTTLDLSPDAIFMCDTENFRVFYANGGAKHLLNYDIAELIGMSVLEMSPELDKKSFDRLLQSKNGNAGKVVRFETEFVNKKGSVIPIQLVLQYQNPADEDPRFVLIARDITERKRDEKFLLKSLEDAQAANQAKSKFLMSVSHELRTPLNAIIGFSQLLELDADSLNSDQNMAVNDIHHAGKHLLKLVDEILDLSRIESDNIPMTIEHVDPTSLIHECVKTVAAMADMKGVTLQNDITAVLLPKIMIDKTRFKQVLMNLLNNAIKYNRTDGKVTLQSELRGNKTIRFKVVDTGCGITTDQQANVFTAFNRLGQEGSDIDGTGIGLSITKRLVELMGGNIDFQSSAGRGSAFWIDFACQDEEDSCVIAPG
ncbi:MAG: ATP-binding protein [Gammaproteobacteria bacterium]|nr:ATP-binding protein [Gammaproteobacteria bacterium]